MVKGCQKKTIHIKDTGSKYYEEAYFVLRPGVSEFAAAECDMISEAMRIADESMDQARTLVRRRSAVRTALSFIAGVTAGAVVAAAILLLIGI